LIWKGRHAPDPTPTTVPDFFRSNHPGESTAPRPSIRVHRCPGRFTAGRAASNGFPTSSRRRPLSRPYPQFAISIRTGPKRVLNATRNSFVRSRSPEAVAQPSGTGRSIVPAGSMRKPQAQCSKATFPGAGGPLTAATALRGRTPPPPAARPQSVDAPVGCTTAVPAETPYCGPGPQATTRKPRTRREKTRLGGTRHRATAGQVCRQGIISRVFLIPLGLAKVSPGTRHGWRNVGLHSKNPFELPQH